MSAADLQGLRQVIREVLVEELGHLKAEAGAFAETTPKPQVREEAVAIRSSADLMAFAHRLLEITKDGRARQEIESGRWVFHLAGGKAGSVTTMPTNASNGQPPGAGGAVRFDRGLVSERQIDAIPKGSDRLLLGKRTRLTPLAHDRIRQRGIQIERVG